MTSPNKLNEFNHAEDPASQLLEQLGWTYAPARGVGVQGPHTSEGMATATPWVSTSVLGADHGDAAAAVVPALRIASGEKRCAINIWRI